MKNGDPFCERVNAFINEKLSERLEDGLMFSGGDVSDTDLVVLEPELGAKPPRLERTRNSQVTKSTVMRERGRSAGSYRAVRTSMSRASNYSCRMSKAIH